MHEYIDDLLTRIFEKNYTIEHLMHFDGIQKTEKLNQLTLELDQLLYEYIKRLKWWGM